MLLSIFFLLLIFFSIILFKNFSSFITLICSILLLSLLINPNNCINSALIGLRLFLYKVFPTMFPFVMLTSIIINYDGIYIYSKLFGKFLCKLLRLPYNCSIVIIISALCGYPIGGKYTSDLYSKDEIDMQTAERLLSIASTCSPLFIVGTIGSSMLNSQLYGYMLLVTSYLSSIIISFILPITKTSSNIVKVHHSLSTKNLGECLKNSLENSLSSCALVGGFIIIFSVILGQIQTTIFFRVLNRNQIFTSIFLGIIEMTNGCNLVHLSKLDLPIKLMLFSFLTSFGGLCVMSQTYAFTYKYKFNMLTYFLRKFIQGIISSTLIIIIYFFYSYTSVYTWSSYVFLMPQINLKLIFLLFILPFILYKITRLIKAF